MTMHYLKPNTQYTIVTLSVAVAATNDAMVADCLNETLRECLDPEGIADYTLHALTDTSIVSTDSNPEEGDLFHSIEGVAAMTTPDNELVIAARAIVHQRDHKAAHGAYDRTTFCPDLDQEFDDWAADILETALATIGA
jgi:hypothetical protein